jgi:flagellar basal body-associated protein FliL
MEEGMADEELNVAEDVGGGGETPDSPGTPKRTGFLPGIVITILKWVAIGLGFVILGATTTLITFSILSGRKPQQSTVGVREPYASAKPIPMYVELGNIRGSTADDTPAVFSGDVKIGYADDMKEVGNELVQRKNQLRNAVMIKLSRKKYEELRSDRLEEVQEELRTTVNGVLSTGKVQEVLLDNFTAIR